MSALDDITVDVEASTGNIPPLLHEIRHALKRLAKGEPGTAIDLRSLPLAPGEEERFESMLGAGEVRAELDSLGRTLVQETDYPGVWLVTHHNVDDTVVAKFVEVTRMPEILMSQQEDIERGISKLECTLQE